MTGDLTVGRLAPGDLTLGDLALIADAALEAGRLALDLQRQGLTVNRKAGGSPVSNADLQVDSFLKARLMAARPDYGWLSEETADNPARLRSRRLFIVDPIDGTTAYIKNRPWYVVAIAVVEDGRPTAAAIYAPAMHELYLAAPGEGATCNGAPIHTGDASELGACRMLGDVALFAHPNWREPWPAMQIERRNAIAYRMCLVASGAFDAAVSLGPKHDWDLAAGDLIAREAGAQAVDASGRPLRFNTPAAVNSGLICAAPRLAPLILARTAPIEAKA